MTAHVDTGTGRHAYLGSHLLALAETARWSYAHGRGEEADQHVAQALALARARGWPGEAARLERLMRPRRGVSSGVPANLTITAARRCSGHGSRAAGSLRKGRPARRPGRLAATRPAWTGLACTPSRASSTCTSMRPDPSRRTASAARSSRRRSGSRRRQPRDRAAQRGDYGSRSRSAGRPCLFDPGGLGEGTLRGGAPVCPPERSLLLSADTVTGSGLSLKGRASIGGLVRHNLARGADVIKLMMRSAARRMELRPDELAAAVAEAHWLDVPVAVHANFSARSIDAAVEAGCDTLEHGFAISEATAKAMSSQGTALCPTTTALQSIVSDPRAWIRRGGRALVERAVKQFPEARLSFERSLAAGVTLVAGTDAGVTGVAFDALAHELETMVEWGASACQTLAAATSNAARLLRHPELGTLESGTPADIVLLRADPLADITACGQVEAVIQAGRLVRLDSPARLVGYEMSAPPGTVLPPPPRHQSPA